MKYGIFFLMVYAITIIGAGIIVGLLQHIDGVLFGAGASAIVSIVTFFIGRAVGLSRRTS